MCDWDADEDDDEDCTGIGGEEGRGRFAVGGGGSTIITSSSLLLLSMTITISGLARPLPLEDMMLGHEVLPSGQLSPVRTR